MKVKSILKMLGICISLIYTFPAGANVPSQVLVFQCQSKTQSVKLYRVGEFFTTHELEINFLNHPEFGTFQAIVLDNAQSKIQMKFRNAEEIPNPDGPTDSGGVTVNRNYVPVTEEIYLKTLENFRYKLTVNSLVIRHQTMGMDQATSGYLDLTISDKESSIAKPLNQSLRLERCKMMW